MAVVPYTPLTLDKERKARIDHRHLFELQTIAGLDITKLIQGGFEITPEQFDKILWISLREEDPTLSYESYCGIVDGLTENSMANLLLVNLYAKQVLKDSLGLQFVEDAEEEQPKNAKSPRKKTT